MKPIPGSIVLSPDPKMAEVNTTKQVQPKQEATSDSPTPSLVDTQLERTNLMQSLSDDNAKTDDPDFKAPGTIITQGTLSTASLTTGISQLTMANKDTECEDSTYATAKFAEVKPTFKLYESDDESEDGSDDGFNLPNTDEILGRFERMQSKALSNTETLKHRQVNFHKESMQGQVALGKKQDYFATTQQKNHKELMSALGVIIKAQEDKAQEDKSLKGKAEQEKAGRKATARRKIRPSAILAEATNAAAPTGKREKVAETGHRARFTEDAQVKAKKTKDARSTILYG